MEPRLRVDGDRGERPDALGEEDVVRPQVHAEIELLDCAADRAVHLDVRDHAARRRALLLRGRLQLGLRAEDVHLVHALPGLQLPALLPLPDVPAEVPVGLGLRRLGAADHPPQRTLPLGARAGHAAAGAVRSLVRLVHDGEPVVQLHVGVPTRERHAQPGGGAVEPGVVPRAEHLAVHVAGAGHLEPALPGNALADEERLAPVHPRVLRELVLARLRAPEGLTRVRNLALSCLRVPLVDVVLRAQLVLL